MTVTPFYKYRDVNSELDINFQQKGYATMLSKDKLKSHNCQNVFLQRWSFSTDCLLHRLLDLSKLDHICMDGFYIIIKIVLNSIKARKRVE
jgi:hypothetical protein